jgi:hypothetical protein
MIILSERALYNILPPYVASKDGNLCFLVTLTYIHIRYQRTMSKSYSIYSVSMFFLIGFPIFTYGGSIAEQRHLRYSSETPTFYQNYLAMKNTTDVTGGSLSPSKLILSLVKEVIELI